MYKEKKGESFMKLEQTKEEVTKRLMEDGKEALKSCLYYEETNTVKQRSARVFYTISCTDGVLYFWINEREQNFGVIEGNVSEFECMIQTLTDQIQKLEKEKKQLQNVIGYITKK